MALNYTASFPLSLPTSPSNFQKSRFELERRSAITKSPFTGKQQVQLFAGYSFWRATLTLPPIKRADAGNWTAFFAKLRGRSGTFLLGDPDGSKQGSGTGSITLASATAVGDTRLSTTGYNESSGVVLKAGDYISIANDLHIVVNDATKSSTNVNVDIEPQIRAVHSQGATVVISGAKGVFRLDTEVAGWEADQASLYGFTFSCSEAV
tara:strand:- start:2553 stop:3176 length:624 start_codon:yes stop_codon:yes gene_type:complete